MFDPKRKSMLMEIYPIVRLEAKIMKEIEYNFYIISSFQNM